MFKKIAASIISACLSVSILASCSDETKYTNKGTERKVSSETVSESSTPVKDSSETSIDILNEIEKNGTGVYEGKVELYNEEKSKTSNCRLEIAENDDIKFIINTPETGAYAGLIYKADNQTLYFISSKFDNTAVALSSLSQTGCIKDHLLGYAVDAAMTNGLLVISDDNKKMKFSFNNSSLYDCLCTILDLVNRDYNEIYKLTKDDKPFMEWAESIIGEYYDLSSGLSQNALYDLTDVVAISASKSLITDAENSCAVTMIFDCEDVMSIDLDVDISNFESGDKVMCFKSKLTRTGKAPESVLLPEMITDKLPEEAAPYDDSDDKPVESENDSSEATTDESEYSSEEPSNDDSSAKENNWNDDDFFS